ncbi:MAG: DUF445 domain-containing protein, partial [Catenulispora sp.]
GWGYAQAAAEASMVGGVADWFAVTALFRHPLGIPIPHTAIIRERKDQFGQTLGTFVQENFLTRDVVLERVRTARVVERAAAWTSDPRNSQALARQAAELVVGLADAVRDEDVHRVLADAVDRGVAALPVSELAGRALRIVTTEDRHQELLTNIMRGLEKFLNENQDSLRARFRDEAPWWLPGAAEDRIFERLVDGVRHLLEEVNADPNHEIRGRFDEWVDEMVERLEHSPEMRQRGEEIKRDLLAHPELRKWTSSLWTDLKIALRTQAADPDSELRLRLAGAVAAAGRRLAEDPALATKAEELVENAVGYVADHFHDEIGSLVSGTIARWDAEETSSKLELLLGPDLQFIRINGTVVGGLVGVAIHAVATALH